MNLYVDNSAQLSVTISPDNATHKRIEWSSDDPNIAEVNANGCVTGKSAGTTCIRAYATDGSGVHRCCEVTVNAPVLVNEINIASDSNTVGVGGSITLTANVLPINATNKKVHWESRNDLIATVDETGLVTAQSVGEVIIIATAIDGSNTYGEYTLTVIERSIRTNVSGTLNIHSTASEEGDILGSVLNGVYVKLEENTPQNWKWYKITAATGDGSNVTGWCNGEYLEEGFAGLTAVKKCYIRSDTYINNNTLIYNPNNSIATIHEGNKIQLWESGTISANGCWYAVNYNGTKAFVTADDNSFNETTIWITLPTHTICNIRVKSNSGAFIKSAPLDDAINIGKFSYHSEISLVDDRLTSEKWYYVYGKNNAGKWTYGWCSAEDLEERIVFGDCIYNEEFNLNIRDAASASGNFITGVNYERKIRILAHKISTDSNGPWHKVLYNDKIAYVIAGKNTDNFSDDIRWFSMANADKKQYNIGIMKNKLTNCDESIINKESVIDMLEPLMSLGYEPAFVAGILANIQAEEKWSLDDNEKELVKLIAKFPSLIEDSASIKRVHPIAQYCQDLAGAFNRFYKAEQVIGSDVENARLILVEKARITLRNALDILGVSAPEMM
jgi:uncharacterized protein YgiM (DUF1202 family)